MHACTNLRQPEKGLWVKNSIYTNDNFNTLLHAWGILTPKHRETQGCVVSTVASEALMLKHQAISIHNAD